MTVDLDIAPRARNAEGTRRALLEAATARFSAEGYDQVGIRDLAADAGCDPSLVCRYFGSKEDLFAAVVSSLGDGAELMAAPREEFGRRTADQIVFGETNDDKLTWLLIQLRSLSSAKASDILQRSATTRFYQPLAEWIGGDDAAIRSRLVAGLIMGMSVIREGARGFNLADDDRPGLRDRLAEILQTLVSDAPLSPGASPSPADASRLGA